MIRHQFRPHFLFNCLNMVSFFIYSNPKQAEAALIHFSNYLRLHLAALNQPEEIPFQIELEHVKAYLSLEQLRFGNKLSVIYNIGCSQFSLSCLCLLSIVENAVRHGLENKDSGGTVIISTYETHSAYVIKVTDDGLGFDPASPPAEDGKPHVGIQTVRQKLEAPGKGMLKIDSRPGMGTAVSILVFKEKVNDHLSG